MSAHRPTFHEAWYRVASLTPRLRAGVRVQRQHYRGRRWWVVRDPATNRFFRMNEAAWRFVGLLDGRRTVESAWNLSNDASADDAPTQGEAIGILGQLHGADLISGDLPADAESLLHRRRRRTEREWRSRLEQLLSVRIPLFDPDRVLGAAAPLVAWLFSPVGMALWTIAVALGAAQLLGRGDRLVAQSAQVLAPSNLLWLYLASVLAKLIHEFGHGIACKVFGRREGTGGEVHALGVMLLVFLPLPYVDATSAWGLRSKWNRVVVGAAGMMAELLLAALAAFIWARATPGSALSAFAFNLLLVAGVSTILFNANPLLRYDGYYILGDLLEAPNLQQRSREALHRLVKKWAWGMKRLPPPSESGAESAWLVLYALASGAYKLFVAAIIVYFVSRQLLIVGALLAAAAVVLWFLVPAGRFVAYLFHDPELERERPRAVAVTLGALALVLAAVGLIPAPRSIELHARAESSTHLPVTAGADGFLDWTAPRGVSVARGEPLARAHNPDASAAQQAALARTQSAQAEAGAALVDDPALASIARVRVEAEQARTEELARRVEALEVRAPASGAWLPDPEDAVVGRFTPRGTRLGFLVDPARHTLRAEVAQAGAAELIGRAGRTVRVRPVGRPELEFAGEIESVIEAGADRSPDPQGRVPERTFEVRIKTLGDPRIFDGQRCVIRAALEPQPLAVRWWRAALRAFQDGAGG